jgi:hypothetical protein
MSIVGLHGNLRVELVIPRETDGDRVGDKARIARLTILREFDRGLRLAGRHRYDRLPGFGEKERKRTHYFQICRPFGG